MSRTQSPSARRARTRSALAIGLAAACASALLSAEPAFADPKDEKKDDKPSLKELDKRAEKLEKKYDSELVQYTDAKKAVKKANKKLKSVDSDVDGARGDVSELAATQYKSGGVDPTVQVVMGDDPDKVLDNAALVDQLSEKNSKRLIKLKDLKKKRAKTADKAGGKLKKAKKLVEDLESQQDEVEKKIKKYKKEQIPGGGGNGNIPADARGPGWDGATPRMASIRDTIVKKFGAPYPVGCLRQGDSGEHGSGRACDFMMSSGGSTPTGEKQQLGQQIADYAQKNADELGVMYIIWEQKIWDTRNSGSGWKSMEDRGSVTANHYDHVHISSY